MLAVISGLGCTRFGLGQLGAAISCSEHDMTIQTELGHSAMLSYVLSYSIIIILTRLKCTEAKTHIDLFAVIVVVL